MVNLKINGISVSVPEGYTILQAAKQVNIEIPSLCYLKDVNCIGSCRVCVVEVKGRKGLIASCVYPVEEGMEVFTNTAAVRESSPSDYQRMRGDLFLKQSEGPEEA